MKTWRVAEDAVMRLMPRRGRRGSTWFGRLGDVVQQPPVWAGIAVALALAGGERGRRAAVRGSVHYGLAAVFGNLVIKPLVRRSRPPGATEERLGPLTTSFPSGHAATDLAFSLAASLELPALFVPLSGATMAAHWSLVRSRGHYPTDVLAGGALAVVLTVVLWRLWPPSGTRKKPEWEVPTAVPAVASPTRGGFRDP
ncbi:MAG: phosphatase PAP2 family protein [Actinomycetota bacterium]|nr:phosphatase PAP2 family protein [Actinomycetota bacterium]